MWKSYTYINPTVTNAQLFSLFQEGTNFCASSTRGWMSWDVYCPCLCFRNVSVGQVLCPRKGQFPDKRTENLMVRWSFFLSLASILNPERHCDATSHAWIQNVWREGHMVTRPLHVCGIYLWTAILFSPLGPQVAFLEGLIWVWPWVLRMSLCIHDSENISVLPLVWVLVRGSVELGLSVHLPLGSLASQSPSPGIFLPSLLFPWSPHLPFPHSSSTSIFYSLCPPFWGECGFFFFN